MPVGHDVMLGTHSTLLKHAGMPALRICVLLECPRVSQDMPAPQWRSSAGPVAQLTTRQARPLVSMPWAAHTWKGICSAVKRAPAAATMSSGAAVATGPPLKAQ